MPTVRMPIVGSITNRNANADLDDAKDQVFVNCFPEIGVNTITGKSSVRLNKRQGAAASADVQTGADGTYGSVVWTSNISAGATDAPVVMSFRKSTGTSVMFFDVANSNAQIGGDVANTSECFFMAEADVGGTGNITTALLDGSALEAWFFPAGGAWTQITDADFPSNIMAAHAHLDGYMFVMTEGGRVYNSDLNSLSSWTATSFITASSFGDKGAGCVRYKNLVVGFGDYSTEFFYNAGNSTGSVLKRVADATIPIGAMRQSVSFPPVMRVVGDSVYWIGQRADSFARGVYRLKGMQAEKISNTAIDRMIANGKIVAIIGSLTLLGMTHVVFMTASTVRRACYCIDTGFWWFVEIGGASGSSLQIAAAIGAVDSAFNKSYVTIDSNNAKVYTFNPNSPVWEDNAIAYSLTVQTDPIDLGTRRMKFWQAVSVIGDKEASASAVGVAFSDSDDGSFATARDVNLNTPAANRLTRLGASRRRSWKLTHSAATPCRLEAIEIEYEVGSH